MNIPDSKESMLKPWLVYWDSAQNILYGSLEEGYEGTHTNGPHVRQFPDNHQSSHKGAPQMPNDEDNETKFEPGEPDDRRIISVPVWQMNLLLTDPPKTRELRVLCALVHRPHAKNEEIANLVDYALPTVNNSLHKWYERTGARNRTELILQWIWIRYVVPPPR